MGTVIPRLALAFILAAAGLAHAAGDEPPPVASWPVAPGDLTWPAGLAVAGWLLGRWQPTIRIVLVEEPATKREAP